MSGRAVARVWAGGRILSVAIALLAAIAKPGLAHPIHTTLTQIRVDPRDRVIVVSIRVFADDFATVVGRHARVAPGRDHAVPEAAMAAYTTAAFALADDAGRRVPLAWASFKRTGDVLWLTLRAPAGTRLAGLTARNTMLWELYDDQVNIVQTELDGRSTSLLFLKGDAARPVARRS